MEDIKKQIIDWFNSPQDYDQGIELLYKVSKKARVLGKLARRGENKASYEKLCYELNKVAGLKKIPVPAAKVEGNLIKKTLPPLLPDKPEAPEKTTKKEKPVVESMNLAGKIKGDYSPVMQRVVKENSALCMQRGKKHKALTSLPEDNSPETIEARLKLMDEIEGMTRRIELLFGVWKEYNDRKTEPDPAELWPEKNDNDEGEGGNKTTSLDDLSVDDLKKLKKNLQASLVKDRNVLKYQSKTKPDNGKENPVPDGPKKRRLEKRIQEKEAEILKLENKIVDKE